MVAVALVGVVQVAVDQIVHVVAMGHGRVAAIGAMLMSGVMRGTIVRGAIGGIDGAHFQGAFVIVAVMGAVEVSVVKKVHVVAVLDRRVAAAGAVDVVVLFVYVMAHCNSPFKVLRQVQVELLGWPAFRWRGPRR